MGLLHSLANPPAVRNSLPTDSPLSTLIARSAPLDPIGRAKLLTESRELEAAHTTASAGGQTSAPAADTSVDLHFTCFVRDQNSGDLIELDGRRKGPVNRGVHLGKQEDLLAGACNWVQDNYVSAEMWADGCGSTSILNLIMSPGFTSIRWQWTAMPFCSISSLWRPRRASKMHEIHAERGGCTRRRVCTL